MVKRFFLKKHAYPVENLRLPTIVGVLRDGQTASIDLGNWSGTNVAYSYQWYASGIAIPGAVNATLLLTAGEIGEFLTCDVTGSDSLNSVTVTTAAVGPVGTASGSLTAFGTPVLTTVATLPYAGFTVSAAGGVGPYVYTKVSGPSWISINSSTGVVSGTSPTVGTNTGIVFRVTDVTLATADLAAFSITTTALPAVLSISGTPITTATQTIAYTGFTVTGAGGTPPYVYSKAAGPAWLNVNSSTGAVTGTNAGSGTDAGIVIRVTDALLATADLAPFSIVTTPFVGFTLAFTPVTGATVSTQYTQLIDVSAVAGTVAISCDPGMTFKINGEYDWSDKTRTISAAAGNVLFAVRSSDGGAHTLAPTATIGSSTAAFSVTTTATTATTFISQSFAAVADTTTLTTVDSSWALANGFTAGTLPTVYNSDGSHGELYFPAGGCYVHSNTVQTTRRGFSAKAQLVRRTVNTSERVGVTARVQASVKDLYWACYEQSSATQYRWMIRAYINNGTDSLLIQGPLTNNDAAGSTYDIEFNGMGSSSGNPYGVVGIAMFLNVSVNGAAATQVLNWVETSKMHGSGSAKCGIIRQSGSAQTTTLGVHITSFESADKILEPPVFAMTTPITSSAPGATSIVQTVVIPASHTTPVAVSFTGGLCKSTTAISGGYSNASYQAYTIYAFPGDTVSVTRDAPAASGVQHDAILALNNTSAIWRLNTTGTASTSPYLWGGTGLADAITGGGDVVYTIVSGKTVQTKRRVIKMPLQAWSGFSMTFLNSAGRTISTGANEAAGDPYDILGIEVYHAGVWHRADFGGRGSMPYTLGAGQAAVTKSLPIAGATGGEEIIIQTTSRGNVGDTPCYPYTDNASLTVYKDSHIDGTAAMNLGGYSQILTTSTAGFSVGGVERYAGPVAISTTGPNKSVWIMAGDSIAWGKDELPTGNYNVATNSRLVAGYIQHGLDSTVGGSICFKVSATPSGIISNITGIGAGQGMEHKWRMVLAHEARFTSTPYTHLWIEGGLNEPGTGVRGYVKTIIQFMVALRNVPVIVSSAMIRTTSTDSWASNLHQSYHSINTTWGSGNNAEIVRDYFAAQVDGAVVWKFVDTEPWTSGIGINPLHLTAAEATDPGRKGMPNPNLKYLAADNGGAAIGVATSGGLHPTTNHNNFVGLYAIANNKATLLP